MTDKQLQETKKRLLMGLQSEGDVIAVYTHIDHLKAERDKAVGDMTVMANCMRDYAETDTKCCFACGYDSDFSVTDSGAYANECPGFDKGDCFEWRGLE